MGLEQKDIPSSEASASPLRPSHPLSGPCAAKSEATMPSWRGSNYGGGEREASCTNALGFKLSGALPVF